MVRKVVVGNASMPQTAVEGDTSCPICRYGLRSPIRTIFDTGNLSVNCMNCGPYQLTRTASYLPIDELLGSKVAHYIRWCDSPPVITSNSLESIASNATPTIRTQADNLVCFMARNYEPGETIVIQPSVHQAAMGSATPNAGVLVVDYLSESGLLNCTSELTRNLGGSSWSVVGMLSAHGHAYYEEIWKGSGEGREAFMAMPFGFGELDATYHTHFVPAVGATGFSLRRIDERPEAGLIDTQMELAIRRSTLVIADLTHGNLGAYWEAGFAEGLGKPVIYTCERSHTESTHFDTSHRQTVFWAQESVEEDMERLKTIIRVTLPNVARLDD